MGAEEASGAATIMPIVEELGLLFSSMNRASETGTILGAETSPDTCSHLKGWMGYYEPWAGGLM